jgi:hypothetical protein
MFDGESVAANSRLPAEDPGVHRLSHLASP